MCIDLFCGLGGWSDGFLAEGFECIGFDIERHDYGTGGYPCQLVLQDVLTLHGSQFRSAACIVASPPCQEFSYMAMPWKRAKQIARALRCDVGSEFPESYAGSRTIAELTALFDACFRIQREASEAAGRYVPMVVENVKGAQPWVGRAQASYGSFYLWGDVRSAGGRIVAAHQVRFGAPTVRAGRGSKNGHVGGGSWFAMGIPGQKVFRANPYGRKVPMNFHEYEKTGKPGRSFQSAAVESSGLKLKDADGYDRSHPQAFGWKSPRTTSSAVSARKAASAQIAKIPFELSRHIARAFKPGKEQAA